MWQPLDVVEAVRHRAGAWGVLWAGVSSPFRFTFGWLRLLPVFYAGATGGDGVPVPARPGTLAR